MRKNNMNYKVEILNYSRSQTYYCGLFIYADPTIILSITELL